ncbi:MAG: hypothetical protein K2H09_07095 [Treponemataceae bacterium]|nr:hypothetical protein [Treponemataceae bacterium]
MVLIADAKQKVAAWIESNVITKIPGEGKRILTAVVVSRALNNAEKLAEGLAKNPVISAAGIIDGDKLDESVLLEIRERLGRGKIELPVPMIGTVGLDGEAIDSLYASLTE